MSTEGEAQKAHSLAVKAMNKSLGKNGCVHWSVLLEGDAVSVKTGKARPVYMSIIIVCDPDVNITHKALDSGLASALIAVLSEISQQRPDDEQFPLSSLPFAGGQPNAN